MDNGEKIERLLSLGMSAVEACRFMGYQINDEPKTDTVVDQAWAEGTVNDGDRVTFHDQDPRIIMDPKPTDTRRATAGDVQVLGERLDGLAARIDETVSEDLEYQAAQRRAQALDMAIRATAGSSWGETLKAAGDFLAFLSPDKVEVVNEPLDVQGIVASPVTKGLFEDLASGAKAQHVLDTLTKRTGSWREEHDTKVWINFASQEGAIDFLVAVANGVPRLDDKGDGGA